MSHSRARWSLPAMDRRGSGTGIERCTQNAPRDGRPVARHTSYDTHEGIIQRGTREDAPRSEHGARVLSDAQEAGLVEHTSGACCPGLGTPDPGGGASEGSHAIVKDNLPQGVAARAVAEKWIADGAAGDKFWVCFKERRPEIVVLLENKMDEARDNVTQEQLDSIFTVIRELLAKHVNV